MKTQMKKTHHIAEARQENLGGRGAPSLKGPQIDLTLENAETSPGQFVIKQPETERYFRLSAETVRIMQCMDGTKTLDEISVETGFNRAAIEHVVDQLTRLHLLMNGGKQGSAQAEKKSRWHLSLFLIRRDIITDDALIDRLYRFCKLKYILQPWLGLVLLFIYVAAIIMFYRYRNPLLYTIRYDLFLHKPYWLAYLMLFLPISIITCTLHEFAHAFTCKHFGGKVRSLGIGMYFFIPVFYSDVSDAWMFTKRYQRLITHAAGILMNFLLASVAILFIPLALHSSELMAVIACFYLTSFVYVLANFNPLIKLDGYYMLADALGIDNMRKKAFMLLFSSIRQMFPALKLKNKSATHKITRLSYVQKQFLLLYALLSLTYTVFLLPYVLNRYINFLFPYLGNWHWVLLGVISILLVSLTLATGWKRREQRNSVYGTN